MHLSRREWLTMAGAGMLAFRRRAQPASRLRVIALGQSLILRDLRTQAVPGYSALRARLAQGDVRFTNLETAIRPADMTTTPPQAVSADAVVLDSLKDLSINLLSLANNHSGNLGEAGYRETMSATRARGLVTAGVGETLAAASAPGVLSTSHGAVALIAMASSAVPLTAMATGTRPGVNHVAMHDNTVDAPDAARVLGAIRTASSRSRVIVYQHDHYWAPDWHDTPDWKIAWCRQCIDAGAIAFISHGVPLLHGIEIYKGRPIFYGLGNFIFHLSLDLRGRVPKEYTEAQVWQSVIADVTFEGNRATDIWLDPIVLSSTPPVGEGEYILHGNPMLASGQDAQEILERLRALCGKRGTTLEIVGSRARIHL